MSALADLFEYNHQMLEEHPSLIPTFRPRQIQTPQGYQPARYVAAALLGLINQCGTKAAQGKLAPTVEMSAYSVTYHILEERVPIYYVSENLAQAIAATEVPEEFTVGDLNWPVPAMVLGFPTRFMREYIGEEFSYVYCADMPAREYKLPQLDGLPTIVVPKHKVITMVFHEYMEGTGNILNAHYLEEVISRVWDKYVHVDFTGASVEQIAENQEKINKITALVYKLLMILGTEQALEQGLITQAKVTRPESSHKGHIRPALWAPNFIGEHYAAPGVPLGGTHASPCIHRRRGHITHQAHGPGRTLRKVIWLQPVWVGLKKGMQSDDNS